jgi:signal peptidase I
LIGVLILVPLVILLLSLSTGGIKTFEVISRSMEPTLLVGDYVFVTGGSHYPDRGDLVVFRNPGSQNEMLVKRVLAVAGDTVSVKNGKIYVNSEMIKETGGLNLENKEMTIEPQQFFVLGDNVANSYDSFDFGPLEARDIAGHPTFIYWPLSRIGKIR